MGEWYRLIRVWVKDTSRIAEHLFLSLWLLYAALLL
jgi:hypothetical protein